MNSSLRKKYEERRALEFSAIKPGSDVRLKVLLVFPSTYRVAMANLGFQLVYAAFNTVNGVCCHRAFVPDPEDMAHHRTGDGRLRSFESFEPLSNYDIIAFSLNYENDLPAVVQILDLAGIPSFARDRREHHPFVIAGGVIPTINPEPIAELLDAVVMGEAEELIPELSGVLMAGFSRDRDRMEACRQLLTIPGMYIPAFYTPRYSKSGQFLGISYTGTGHEPELYRRIVPRLEQYPGSTIFHTPEREFKDLHLVEISRGCPRKCHFCLIHGCYKPFRYREMPSVLEESQKAVKGERIGLLGAGAADHPRLTEICNRLYEAGSAFSFSSLHASEITPELADIILKGGPKTVTLAPECGSEVRRRKMGKRLSEEQIFDAVKLIGMAPVKHVKLYFIIGLPGEVQDDIEDIVTLSKRINHEIKVLNAGAKQLPRLTVGVSCFVPKAQTPFEHVSMLEEKALKLRIKFLLQKFRKHKEIRFTHDIPKWAALQGLLARGDRRVSGLLAEAAKPGASWARILRTSPVNVGYYLYRKTKLSDVLPWDHLKVPVFHNRLDFIK